MKTKARTRINAEAPLLSEHDKATIREKLNKISPYIYVNEPKDKQSNWIDVQLNNVTTEEDKYEFVQEFANIIKEHGVHRASINIYTYIEIENE